MTMFNKEHNGVRRGGGGGVGRRGRRVRDEE